MLVHYKLRHFAKKYTSLTNIRLLNVNLFKKASSNHSKNHSLIKKETFLSLSHTASIFKLGDGIIPNSSPLTAVIIHPHPATLTAGVAPWKCLLLRAEYSLHLNP